MPFRGTFTHGRAKSMSAGSSMPMHTTIKKRSTELDIDPKDIDKHLEAMLDRRNIPENQRYKMRNLADTIKMEFIRQDWAEMAAAAKIQPAKTKRSRGRSFTLSRINKTGKKGDKTLSSLSRHLRSKSSETLADEKPLGSSFADASDGVSGNNGGGNGTGLLAKIMVSWIEDFIRQGGMEEMVALLHGIMEIEWRDEHEDALLHETLLCLKALSTTAVAQVYIHSIRDELFPRLLHLLFDPEKKGPSEFTTRNIVTSILFMYIESGAPSDRISRAANVLIHLRDPEPPESERPVGFVLSMHRPRPYRVWNKEVVNVTKEVFWIFLHHLNIVAVPEKMNLDPEASSLASADEVGSALKYMTRHFPAERPPVAAAPYVGGVEWDATNYLASHVDLLNAIIACTPSRDDRNQLRSELRVSGWERCMGGSLRLCKEKFYPSVHEALRTWVSAAMEDGWDVKDVRYGPPPESRSRSVSPSKSKVSPMTPAPLNLPGNPGGGGGGVIQAKVAAEAAPRLELPVPKMLSDSDSETSSMRGRNAVPPADYRADDSWLR
ncbi:GTPase-binding protein rid1 [Ceratocystis platani]|uniref:GTPase-binding protein rid1 n=1 Tax=Ceratocystis fimbriata f. sp. platani TaxID=88771 RepID=A0A0F8BK76_CERFI|nr:GTPase-binding protein rid1 [Ceratocystis platani]